MFVCKFGMFVAKFQCLYVIFFCCILFCSVLLCLYVVPMFVLKFVPTIYDDPDLQVLIGCRNKSANQIAHCSIIVNTRNELQNKHWNFATDILN